MNFVLFLAKGIGFFLWCLPGWIRSFFGRCLGFLWFDLFRIRRQLVDRNIQIVFPEMEKRKRVQLARKSLHHLGWNFVESLMIPALPQDFSEKHLQVEGREHFEKAVAQEKGVLLLSVHIGSVDLGTVLLGSFGTPVYLLSKEFKSKWLNDFWFGIRKQKGIRFIKPHGTQSSFQILKALKNKHAVMFVIDQFMGRPFGITAEFFGKETGTPYGLALFHRKTKSPVIPVYTYRDQNGKTHIRFEPEVELKLVDDRDENIRIMVDAYNRVVEMLVLRHPEQWMWVHDRWKRKL